MLNIRKTKQNTGLKRSDLSQGSFSKLQKIPHQRVTIRLSLIRLIKIKHLEKELQSVSISASLRSLFTAILYTNGSIVLGLVVSPREFQQNVQTNSSTVTWTEHHFFRGASPGQKPLLQVSAFIIDGTLMLACCVRFLTIIKQTQFLNFLSSLDPMLNPFLNWWNIKEHAID